jgi:NADH-quinone oxidoreductase subunit G
LIPFFWAPGWNSIQAVNKFQSEVGGSLRGGDPGVRLIEPLRESGWQYCSEIPPQFKALPGEWLLIPIFHIFGSEELSRHAQGIAQLLPHPYVALNPVEAALLGVKASEQIKVTADGAQFELEVMLRADIPRGVAGLPAGLPPLDGGLLPAFCKLSPIGAEVSTRGVP